MKKIVNINVPGYCNYGYAGPAESDRGGSRKSPESFSGAAPPALRRQSSKKTCRIIAAFLAFLMSGAFFAPVKPHSKKEWKNAATGMLWPLGLLSACSNSSNASMPAPGANAGAPQIKTLAAGGVVVTLNGSASANSDGKTYEWSCIGYDKKGYAITGTEAAVVAGLGVVSSGVDVKTANVTLKKAGEYTFQLAIKNGAAVESTSTVKVTVSPYTDTRYLTTTPLTFTPDTELAFVVPNFDNVAAMWSGFNPNDVTWTLTCSLGTYLSVYATSKQPIPGTDYGDGPVTITQVFKYEGTIVGQRIIETGVCTSVFMMVKVDGGINNDIPALSLPVSQEIAEVL